MANLSLGPFSVDAEIVDFGVRVSVKLDFKVLEYEWDANLSANDPEISFSTGDVAKFSGGITVGINDATGEIYARAKVCFPVYDPPFSIDTECEGFDASLKILPTGALCMLAQGVTKAGLSFFNDSFAGNMPSCQDIATVRQHLTPELRDAMVSFKDITAGGQSLMDVMGSALNAVDRSVLPAVSTVTADDLAQVITGVVTNPEVNTIYPGLAEKFGLKPPAESKAARPGDALAVVKEIAADIAVTIVLEFGVASAIGAVVAAIVAVVGAGSIIVGTVSLGPAIIAGLALFLALLLLIGIVLIPLLAIVAAIALILIEVFTEIEEAELRQSLLAS